MARYLMQISLAPGAFAALVQNPDNRADAVRPIFEAMGGRLEEYYFAVGENTVYTLGEMPDHVSMEALTMAVLAGGAVTSTKSTAILTAKEAVDAMKKAKDVGYRPPAG